MSESEQTDMDTREFATYLSHAATFWAAVFGGFVVYGLSLFDILELKTGLLIVAAICLFLWIGTFITTNESVGVK